VSRSDQGGWKDEQSVRVIEGDDRTHVIAKGQVYMSWAPGDEGARRMAIVQLYENGMGTQEQLAEAFGVHVKRQLGSYLDNRQMRLLDCGDALECRENGRASKLEFEPVPPSH
jgi:hypothetical protein